MTTSLFARATRRVLPTRVSVTVVPSLYPVPVIVAPGGVQPVPVGPKPADVEDIPTRFRFAMQEIRIGKHATAESSMSGIGTLVGGR